MALGLYNCINSRKILHFWRHLISKKSFLSQFKELKFISSGIIADIQKQDGVKLIRTRFRCENEGLVDSIRLTLRDPDPLDLLRLLLWVDFERTNEVQSIG